MNKNFIILAPDFPYNTPKALRVRAFVKLFNELGYDAVVICYNFRPSSERSNFIDGVKRIIPIKPTPKGVNKLLLPLSFRKLFKAVINDEKPSFIFTCALPEIMLSILQISRLAKLPVILECCEWYDETTFKNGRFDLHYIIHSFAWRFLYSKADGVIAISKMIENHYVKKGLSVLRIPSIIDTSNTPCRINDSNSNLIKLIFAGSFARTKDSIKEFIEALRLVDNDRIRFVIAGVDRTELIDHIGEELYSRYANRIELFGRIHQEEINRIYRECDYGIFFRQKKRQTEAGFSTKIAEGMASGTPFIVNDTGDISLYIKSGINGFIVDDIKGIARVYNEISNINNEKKKQMRVNARKTSETEFNCMSYKSQLKYFLDCIMEKKKNEKEF